MIKVFSADIVLVDARSSRGIGVGAEMLWAKMNSIPVICLAPFNSHYYKESTIVIDVHVKIWCHPFVENLSDIIVNDIDQICKYIKKIIDDKYIKIKGPDSIWEAIKYCKSTNLGKDHPVKKLMETNAVIRQRSENLRRFKEKPQLL